MQALSDDERARLEAALDAARSRRAGRASAGRSRTARACARAKRRRGRKGAWARRARAPARRDTPAHDRLAHRRRHRVESLRARLKGWRAVATRYDKTAASLLGGLHLAAALDRLPDWP